MLWTIIILAGIGVGCMLVAAVAALLDWIERHEGRGAAICTAIFLLAASVATLTNLF